MYDTVGTPTPYFGESNNRIDLWQQLGVEKVLEVGESLESPTQWAPDAIASLKETLPFLEKIAGHVSPNLVTLTVSAMAIMPLRWAIPLLMEKNGVFSELIERYLEQYPNSAFGHSAQMKLSLSKELLDLRELFSVSRTEAILNFLRVSQMDEQEWVS